MTIRDSIGALWARVHGNGRWLALLLAASLQLACTEQPADTAAMAGASAPSTGGTLAPAVGGAMVPVGPAGTGGQGGSGASGAAMTGQSGSAAASGGAPASGGSGGLPGSGGSGGTPASGTGGQAAGSGGSSGSMPPPTASEGCGVAPAPAGDASIEVDAMTRTYIVELPGSYDPSTPYPMIFAFHGAGLDAERFRGYFRLGSVAGEQAIIVYLDALGNPTGWQYNRDLPFVQAALARLSSQYCVDERRVFATGHSSGGYFTNAVGCRLGSQFRAIAPVSGGVGVRDRCEGMPAAWIAHGSNDTIVPTDQGRSARDFWTERNGCDSSMSSPVDPMPCVSYADCDSQAPVHYCEYDGSHSPPSFAVEALWSFFKAL